MSSELSTPLAVGQVAVRATGAQRVSASDETRGNERPQRGQSLPPTQTRAEPKAEAAEEEILQVVDKLREQVSAVGKDLNFEVDRESGYTVIKVVDPATEEVVRQIPAEEVVERARQQNGEIALVEELA